jgi:hypothetical protein
MAMAVWAEDQNMICFVKAIIPMFFKKSAKFSVLLGKVI